MKNRTEIIGSIIEDLPDAYKDNVEAKVEDVLNSIANDKGYGGENPFMGIAGYGLLGANENAR
jgi:hypothetical protein